MRHFLSLSKFRIRGYLRNRPGENDLEGWKYGRREDSHPIPRAASVCWNDAWEFLFLPFGGRFFSISELVKEMVDTLCRYCGLTVPIIKALGNCLVHRSGFANPDRAGGQGTRRVGKSNANSDESGAYMPGTDVRRIVILRTERCTKQLRH